MGMLCKGWSKNIFLFSSIIFCTVSKNITISWIEDIIGNHDVKSILSTVNACYFPITEWKPISEETESSSDIVDTDIVTTVKNVVRKDIMKIINKSIQQS